MAGVANPAKVFQFAVEINGVDQFTVQEVNWPDEEVEVVTHGGTGPDIKTAGKPKIGDITLKGLRPTEGGDRWAVEWMGTARNRRTGAGLKPSSYKKVITIRQLAEDMVSTVEARTYGGVFPYKVTQDPFKRTASDNSMQTVTLSVDERL